MSKYTAVVHKRPGVPMRWLHKKGLLKGRVLDYGCGRGFDADYYGLCSFDPYWRPRQPRGTFDTITCHYVLNVVTLKVQECIIERIRSLLRPNGKAYFTVRRDFKEDYEGKGCIQRLIYLPFKSIRKNSRLEMYEMEGEIR